jgi:hypothetical protein
MRQRRLLHDHHHRCAGQRGDGADEHASSEGVAPTLVHKPQTCVYQSDRASRTACRTATLQ